MEELQRQINILTKRLDALTNTQTIPLEVDRAFRERFRDSLGTLSTSTKSASSENQAVDEGGTDTYSVLGAPDGFDQRSENGIIKYYPYYT